MCCTIPCLPKIAIFLCLPTTASLYLINAKVFSSCSHMSYVVIFPTATHCSLPSPMNVHFVSKNMKNVLHWLPPEGIAAEKVNYTVKYLMYVLFPHTTSTMICVVLLICKVFHCVVFTTILRGSLL